MPPKINIKLKDHLSEDGKLDLSILNLTSVPNVNEILALRKVKSIDLSNNQIECLPDDFIKLEGIHTLYLSKNRLTKLPDNFGQLKSLKQLDLFDNQITDLPLSFCELTKLEYLDLKNNPLHSDLQNQAGKCLNRKECQLCADKVVKYMQARNDEYEKEQALKLKKKQANEKAKAKKREKQAEKERDEKRLKRLESAQKRKLESEQQRSNETSEDDNNVDSGNITKSYDDDDDEPEGIVSQIIDGFLYGIFLSILILLVWEFYQNRHQSMNFQHFYKHL